MEHQADAPQECPDVILMPVMAALVGKNVGKRLGVCGGFLGNVDHRAEKAEEAGGLCHKGLVDGNGGIRFDTLPCPLQTAGEIPVDDQPLRKRKGFVFGEICYENRICFKFSF